MEFIYLFIGKIPNKPLNFYIQRLKELQRRLLYRINTVNYIKCIFPMAVIVNYFLYFPNPLVFTVASSCNNNKKCNLLTILSEKYDSGCPIKHGNSVTNLISVFLWISIVIPNFKSHIITMSARVYFMITVNDCKYVSIMSPQDEQ